MESLHVCFLLIVPRGAINGLELHLLSLSETGHCQMEGYAEHSTGLSFQPSRGMRIVGTSHW